MMEAKEEWWVLLWTKGKIIQEYLAGPYDDEVEARSEAHRQVQIKPEGSIIGLCTSLAQSSPLKSPKGYIR